MPIVVDPSFVWPPEVDPVSSPDGRITAIVDAEHAGVLLRADYSDIAAQTEYTNLNPNPSFENGTTGYGWNGSRLTVTTTTTNPYVGTTAALATVAADTSTEVSLVGPAVTVTPGDWCAASMQVRGAAGSPSVFVYVIWKDANGSFLTSTLLVPATPTTATYSRLAGTVQAPALAATAQMYLYVGNQQGPPTIGQQIVTDAWMVATDTTQEAAAAQIETYFDGDTSDSTPYVYSWTGTPHDSTSTKVQSTTDVIAQVRFERSDGTAVRSGDPAWAPGGWAYAYDQEATLGSGMMWRAVPIFFDGTEGDPSQYVSVTIPAPTDGWAWLKPIADPGSALLLRIEPPSLEYDGRLATTSIAGARQPAATWDVLEGYTTQIRALVRDEGTERKLLALFDDGPLLAQFPAAAGIPDSYLIRGKVSLEHVHWDGYPWRRWTIDVATVARPATNGSHLRIPGLTYDAVASGWTTYDQLAATVPTYNTLLES